MTPTDLTEPQRKALAYLATVECKVAPADLGNAMGETTARRYRAQVQGRRGAVMGKRLTEMGLAFTHYRPAPFYGLRFSISPAGRKALS